MHYTDEIYTLCTPAMDFGFKPRSRTSAFQKVIPRLQICEIAQDLKLAMKLVVDWSCVYYHTWDDVKDIIRLKVSCFSLRLGMMIDWLLI